MITHVVAMDSTQAIGKGNLLPWHLPEDLKHFKEVTLGKTVIMGSNTFRSIVSYSKGKPLLPGRKIIVICSSPTTVTRLNDEIPQPTDVAYWTKAVLDMYLKQNTSTENIIIGGSQLYGTYEPDKVISTSVNVVTEDADSYYPWDLTVGYSEESSETLTSVTGINFSYKTYTKIL